HGDPNYFGAAPPRGDRPHRYIFAVHALDLDALGLDDEATPAACSGRMLAHTIARARLTVTHEIPARPL
ncbi:MAG: YbhB/YbcL family Raf kinase inhibitor-like protein, partial [Schaalia hyovaginalis]